MKKQYACQVPGNNSLHSYTIVNSGGPLRIEEADDTITPIPPRCPPPSRGSYDADNPIDLVDCLLMLHERGTRPIPAEYRDLYEK